MNQPITNPATKGFLLGLILIIIDLVTYFSGIRMDGGIQWLGYVIFLVGIILFIAQYGKQINYNSTFGNYFAHGFKISAIVTVMMIIYVVAFILLFPEFKDKAMDEARKNMQSKKISEEQMDKAIEISQKFFTTFLIAGTLVGYLILGVIASLIGAAITKKNPNNFQQQIDQIG